MRRGLALLSLALGLVLAPGCGSQDAVELDPVASAASKTSEAGSSRVSVRTTMDVAGEKMSFGGEGIFAYDEVRGSMTMDLSSVLPGSGEAIVEVRMLGSMMYMRMPELLSEEAELPEGKQWIGFDLDKALGVAGMGALSPSQLQQDPAEMLRLLRASSSEVKELGKVAVRGVETTRYAATLDMTKAVNATAEELGLSEQQRTDLRAAAQQLKRQAGVGRIPIEVFVDADGLLRRMLMAMSLEIEGERVSMEILSDYHDFGVEVDVEAPPADQVFDVSDEVASGVQG